MNTIAKIIFSLFWTLPVVLLVYVVVEAHNTIPDSSVVLLSGVCAVFATLISAIKVGDIWSTTGSKRNGENKHEEIQ